LADGNQRYQSFVEEFQRMHPKITVQISSDFSWPGGDILPYLVDEFDCFYTGMDTISQPRLLYSLSNFIAREDTTFASDFYPGRINAFRSGDQIYGLPASNMLSLIYYNADLLAQKSLQPPSTDWTFEDLLRLSNAVSSGSSSGPVFGTGGTEDLFFASRDVHWVDLSGEPPLINFTQPSTIEAVNWFTQWTQIGVVYPLAADRANSLNHAISGGQVAFWSGLSRQANANAFSFQYGVAPVPALSSSTGGIGWLMGSGQFISRQSQDPEACWSWMKYLSQKVATFPDVPARRSVVQSSDYAAMVGKETASVYDAAQRNSQKAEMSLTLGPIRQWTWQALTSIFQGNDMHRTLNEAQQKTEVYLRCLDTAGLLHKEILSASPANKSQREQLGSCAMQADPTYIDPLLQ
jgi:ABC-type glycerol-3-phosphate transport system substrate-binding protein